MVLGKPMGWYDSAIQLYNECLVPLLMVGGGQRDTAVRHADDFMSNYLRLSENDIPSAHYLLIPCRY